MSALGQKKQTCAAQKPMSALGQKRRIKGRPGIQESNASTRRALILLPKSGTPTTR